MTNLADPTRYDLLGVPTPTGDLKAGNAISAANYYPFASKRNRDLLQLQYENMTKTLKIFADINFTEAGNTFRDDVKTDGDDTWYPGTTNDSKGYYLFPTTQAKNGGWQRPGTGGVNAAKYVVPNNSGYYSFFSQLKAAAQVLNKTDAIITGTELGGFDTHQTQGNANGSHANLQRCIGWAMYALRKYFQQNGDKAKWNDVVVVTLSEFGRTSVENSDNGTDHAEAGAMFVTGGAVKGYSSGIRPGVFGCSDTESIPWIPGPRTTNLTTCGTMFAANTGVTAGYLPALYRFPIVLGEIIRKHLGATQNQLNRIIPGYAVAGENLLGGGTSSVDGVQIHGELGII